MSQTRVTKCECSHDFQDWKYGKGLRVKNEGVTKGGNKKFICTVCGKEEIT